VLLQRKTQQKSRHPKGVRHLQKDKHPKRVLLLQRQKTRSRNQKRENKPPTGQKDPSREKLESKEVKHPREAPTEKLIWTTIPS
jgi:hypothetical protein